MRSVFGRQLVELAEMPSVFVSTPDVFARHLFKCGRKPDAFVRKLCTWGRMLSAFGAPPRLLARDAERAFIRHYTVASQRLTEIIGANNDSNQAHALTEFFSALVSDIGLSNTCRLHSYDVPGPARS